MSRQAGEPVCSSVSSFNAKFPFSSKRERSLWSPCAENESHVAVGGQYRQKAQQSPGINSTRHKYWWLEGEESFEDLKRSLDGHEL